VRDWLRIDTPVGRPEIEHPKRPIEGLTCQRSEVSGQRLWGLFAARFGTPESLFADHFVANYCPLVFMEASGRNRTPDKLPAAEREPLFAACDRHLRRTIKHLQPRYVIGIGRFAEDRIRSVLADGTSDHRSYDVAVARVPHPSPASPAANRNWPGAMTDALTAAGIRLPSTAR